MSHHDQKLQQWQQGLKQQICEYDASIKKLESENEGNEMIPPSLFNV
jgi:hypothetical protein